jgi:uracil-DNA glycosylase
VILLNTILTVRENEPLSHSFLNWEELTNEIICVLNDQTNPIVFVLWGKSAQKKSVLITNPIHKVITSSHPSPLGAYRGFLNSKPFSQINEFLRAKGREEIKWEDSSF